MNGAGWTDNLGFGALLWAVFAGFGLLALATGWVLKALVGAAARTVRRARFRRSLRRPPTSAAAPAPWREPGYGLARALAEPGHTAARERVAALLEPISGADRTR